MALKLRIRLHEGRNRKCPPPSEPSSLGTATVYLWDPRKREGNIVEEGVKWKVVGKYC
jgi:hypothetical protein